MTHVNCLSHQSPSTPAVDLLESESNYLILAELPGVSRDDITIELESQQLRLETHEATDTGPHFSRRFKLPLEVDPQGIEASLQDGLLSVRIPKTAPAGARRIEVKAN